MATETHTELVDDLDGGPADESMIFTIDGVQYEIDLSFAHAEELREAMQPWMDAGRRLTGRGPRMSRTSRTSPPPRPQRSTPARDGSSREKREALVAFAVARGMKPPSLRGRVATALVEEWKAAGSPM